MLLRAMKKFINFILVLLCTASLAAAADFTALCTDRLAIEQVYYQHRLGTKPPFAEALPRATLESLVAADVKKESALREHYGVAITPALLAGEVQRINNTTRAPETLAEIKTALGNDAERFANAFAKPLLVERLLRDKFENDDTLHAATRQTCEQTRSNLLATCRSRREEGLDSQLSTPNSQLNASLLTSAPTNDLAATLLAQLKQTQSNAVTETTWLLTAPPAETNAPAADEMEIKKRFGANAQIISSPHDADKERKFYFTDLPAALQNVLRVQLRAPGDVSAVIETPGGFLLYLLTEKTADKMSVASLTLPKRSYEDWLNQPPAGTQ